jgi:hypothetical protein
MDNTLNWLDVNNVENIVFGPHNNDNNFNKINEKIKETYVWQEFNHSRQRHIGLWVKTKSNIITNM